MIGWAFKVTLTWGKRARHLHTYTEKTLAAQREGMPLGEAALLAQGNAWANSATIGFSY